MLFTTHHIHPDGPTIRVRRAHAADRGAVALLLLQAHGTIDDGELEARRLLRHDPRTLMTLCATVWDDGHEAVVGVAVARLARGAEPHVLVSDEEVAPGAEAALREAVAQRVSVIAA